MSDHNATSTDYALDRLSLRLETLHARIASLDTSVEDSIETKVGALAALTTQRFAGHDTAVLAAFAAAEKAVNAALAAQEKAVAAALAAQVKAVETALAAVDEQNRNHSEAHARDHQSQALALSKMETRIDEKFHDNNRFRKQIEGERLNYVRRDMLDVIERNTRTMIEKLDTDTRIRLEKSETDLRIRIDAEVATRLATLAPVLAWQQRSGGQTAVWVALGGVAITVGLAVILFIADMLLR